MTKNENSSTNMELPETIINDIQLLANHYESSPILKGLVKMVPYGSAVDSVVSVAWNNYKKAKLKTFFDELANGKIELTEGIVSSNEFLHAFFRTLTYIENNRTEEKIKRFSHILTCLGAGDISFNEFEDFTSAFNDLSEREFTLMSIKKDFELKFPNRADASGKELNPFQLTSSYWNEFKEAAKETLSIDDNMLTALLIRVQRTGCYALHKGYWDDEGEQVGNTTILFHKILVII